MSFCARINTTSSSVPGIRLNGLVTDLFTVQLSASLQQDLNGGC
jgi:hypothetical protein